MPVRSFLRNRHVTMHRHTQRHLGCHTCIPAMQDSNKMHSLLRQAEQKLLRRKKKKRKFGKPPKPPRPPENLPAQKRGMKLHLKLGGADISRRSDAGPPPLRNENHNQ